MHLCLVSRARSLWWGFPFISLSCSEFQTVTAGKFKRTLTPTKKVTRADLDKSKQDLEQVLGQFSGFVAENRPKLDIDSVATGETWFGNAALEKGLCDDIKTVDDVLLEFVDLGYNVYEVDYSPPPAVPQGLAQLLPATSLTEGEGNFCACSTSAHVFTTARL